MLLRRSTVPIARFAQNAPLAGALGESDGWARSLAPTVYVGLRCEIDAAGDENPCADSIRRRGRL
jgi:hypothetical protein